MVRASGCLGSIIALTFIGAILFVVVPFVIVVGSCLWEIVFDPTRPCNVVQAVLSR